MKRPRTQRRIDERAARQRVRDKERLFELSVGGAAERPFVVDTAAVIEGRAEASPCVQCGGAYRIREHASAGPGLRRVDVTCRTCGTPRALWFRIAEPN